MGDRDLFGVHEQARYIEVVFLAEHFPSSGVIVEEGANPEQIRLRWGVVRLRPSTQLPVANLLRWYHAEYELQLSRRNESGQSTS
jgi:hypothetical protein